MWDVDSLVAELSKAQLMLYSALKKQSLEQRPDERCVEEREAGCNFKSWGRGMGKASYMTDWTRLREVLFGIPHDYWGNVETHRAKEEILLAPWQSGVEVTCRLESREGGSGVLVEVSSNARVAWPAYSPSFGVDGWMGQQTHMISDSGAISRYAR